MVSTDHNKSGARDLLTFSQECCGAPVSCSAKDQAALRKRRFGPRREVPTSRFAAERCKRRGLGKPETFNFLGFTFIRGKTSAGKFQIKPRTQRC
jgi:hypothetical protein